jgi:hypothetical protein
MSTKPWGHPRRAPRATITILSGVLSAIAATRATVARTCGTEEVQAGTTSAHVGVSTGLVESYRISVLRGLFPSIVVATHKPAWIATRAEADIQ